MNNRVEKVKIHFQKHKTVYLCTATGVVVAGITCLIMRSDSSQRIGPGIPGTASSGIPGTGENVVINNASKFLIGSNKTLNSVSYITADRQGPPSWVIRCIETDQIFTSQRAAALAMDLPESEISKHLNGAVEHVREFRFERICMAA